MSLHFAVNITTTYYMPECDFHQMSHRQLHVDTQQTDLDINGYRTSTKPISNVTHTLQVTHNPHEDLFVTRI